MSNAVYISAICANTGSRRHGMEVAEQFVAAFPHVPTYQFQPQPGAIYANALGWQAVLDISADLIQIGTFFWALRKAFPATAVAQKPEPFILVQIRSANGQHKQVILKPDEQEKEVFLTTLENTVREVSSKNSEGSTTPSALCDAIENSGSWVRIVKHRDER